MYVPAKDGVTKWFDGCEITVKLRAASTNGTLGFAEGLIPPVRWTRARCSRPRGRDVLPALRRTRDSSTAVHTSSPVGDIVRVRRGMRHGQESWAVRRPGSRPVHPGGAEGLFVEGGDEPQPGVPVQLWGSENWREPKIVELFKKYGCEILL